MLWNVTPSPPTLSQSSSHVFFLAGLWSTSGWGGNAHFLPPQEYDRGRQEKTNRRTNTNKLGVTKSRGRYCNTICMCGLSLAWVTCENSTMLLESDILRLFFTGPYLVSSSLCSGVWCWLPLRSSTPTSAVRLSPVQPQLLSRVQPPTASLLSSLNSLRSLQPPTASLLSCHRLPLLGRVVNSRSRPLTTSGYGEIFFVQESFVWFRAKTDSSALAAYPHSATYPPLLPLSFILNKLQHDLTTSKKKNKNIYRK